MIESDRNIAKHLMVEEGTPIFMIKRVRSIDEGPVSLHLSYIPMRYSHGLTPELMENEQLCVVLNQNYGLQRKRVTETLESVAADKEEAAVKWTQPAWESSWEREEQKESHPSPVFENRIHLLRSR